jgi:hypothetical protein
MTEINKEIDEIEQSFDRLQELIEKHQLGKNNLFGNFLNYTVLLSTHQNSFFREIGK